MGNNVFAVCSIVLSKAVTSHSVRPYESCTNDQSALILISIRFPVFVRYK